MAHTTDPVPELPPRPAVSLRTVPVAGVLVDFYGLGELPADTESVSVLWLHHGRTGKREDLADIAARTVHAVAEAAGSEAGRRRHRLVAAAFDQRNHGSRLVSRQGNQGWLEGNATHAQDMFGMVAGTVADTRLLIDLVGGYHGVLPGHVAVTQHLVLGVSLGGHSAWQLLFSDERVTAGVVIIGCPDYINLVSNRARENELATYKASETVDGPPFIGSRDFPAALVAACRKHDPKAIVFGTDEAVWPSKEREQDVHDILQERVAGKRILLCSGGADKLVPYVRSAPFVSVFKQAASTWPDLALTVTDNVYEGIGHQFSRGMVLDAVQFVKETVADAPSDAAHEAGTSKTSKI